MNATLHKTIETTRHLNTRARNPRALVEQVPNSHPGLHPNLLNSLSLTPLIIDDGKFDVVYARFGRAELELLASAGSRSINLILEGSRRRFGLS